MNTTPAPKPPFKPTSRCTDMGLFSKPKAPPQPQQPPPPPPPPGTAPANPFFTNALRARGFTSSTLGGTAKTLGKPLLKVPSKPLLQNTPGSLGKSLINGGMFQ